MSQDNIIPFCPRPPVPIQDEPPNEYDRDAVEASSIDQHLTRMAAEAAIWTNGHEQGWNDAIDEVARRGILQLLIFLIRNRLRR